MGKMWLSRAGISIKLFTWTILLINLVSSLLGKFKQKHNFRP